MVIKTSVLQPYCSVLNTSIDISKYVTTSDVIEIKAENNNFYLSMTNGEYYVRIHFPADESDNFYASVNATTFLKLISKITTDTVLFSVDNNTLYINANGKYKLPLVFEDEKMVTLPEMEIKEVTTKFDLSSMVLKDISVYNSSQMNSGVITNIIQKLYYVDNEGAITFSAGACVNNFQVQNPFKILINQKLVNLFKLFDDETVHVSIGQDKLSEDIVQTKLRIEGSAVDITAALSCDDSMLNAVPATIIRNRANKSYPYNVNVGSNVFKDAINRLLIFADSNLHNYLKVVFTEKNIVISNLDKDNSEAIAYTASEGVTEDLSYECVIDAGDLLNILNTYKTSAINISFGDKEALVFKYTNIVNVVPEVDME